MSKFTLEIDMNNAAFDDAPFAELRWIIMSELLSSFETCGRDAANGISLRDSNGNIVGKWAVVPDEHA